MNWALFSIGILLILSGTVIWRYNLAHLLSNTEATRIINEKKATRLAGQYLIGLGACFALFGYLANDLSQKQVVLVIACFIPINLVFLVTYLVKQSRNMK